MSRRGMSNPCRDMGYPACALLRWHSLTKKTTTGNLLAASGAPGIMDESASGSWGRKKTNDNLLAASLGGSSRHRGRVSSWLLGGKVWGSLEFSSPGPWQPGKKYAGRDNVHKDDTEWACVHQNFQQRWPSPRHPTQTETSSQAV